MKYLRKYESHSNYSGDYNDIKSQKVCVSLVKDECTKMPGSDEVKNRIFFKSKSYDAWAGDILCWNTDDKKWQIYKVDHDETKYATKPLGTQLSELHLVPDAVCVVPACHTDNGKARWCALNDANIESLKYNTYNGRCTYYWGSSAQRNTLIDELGVHCLFPRSKVIDSNSDGTPDDVSNTEMADAPYILDENFPGTFYIGEIGDNNKLNFAIYTQPDVIAEVAGVIIAPSFSPINGTKLSTITLQTLPVCGPWAYGNDGFSKNPLATQPYKQNVAAFDNAEGLHVGMDFDGLRNTQILLKLSPSGNEYPAAMATALYGQTYSPAGSWYLPSAGELIYLIARWYTIQHTLYLLNPDCLDDSHTYNADPNTASPLDCHGIYYWSSTQGSADSAVSLITDYGNLGWNYKDNYFYVRPFRSF